MSSSRSLKALWATAPQAVSYTHLRPGKKLLATGNGRCNLDNEGITPESYSSADRAALDALLRTVNAADPLGWSHYGTKAVEYLFGTTGSRIYKVVFVGMTVVLSLIHICAARSAEE